MSDTIGYIVMVLMYRGTAGEHWAPSLYGRSNVTGHGTLCAIPLSAGTRLAATVFPTLARARAAVRGAIKHNLGTGQRDTPGDYRVLPLRPLPPKEGRRA